VTDLVPRCCVESWVSARVSESKNISESNNECMNRWVREWLTWCHAAALNLERVQEWVRVKGWARRAMSVRLTGNTPCFTYLQVWCRDFEHECMSGNTPCFTYFQIWCKDIEHEWQHSLLYLPSDLVQGHWAWMATLLALLTFSFGDSLLYLPSDLVQGHWAANIQHPGAP